MKRISIVTGASSGMGTCFAKQLAMESACFTEKSLLLLSGATKSGIREAEKLRQQASDEIWIIARRQERLLEVAKEIDIQAEKFNSESRAVRSGLCNNLYPEIKVFAVDLCGRDGAIKVNELLKNEELNDKDLRINVLVNNAGFGTYGEFAKTDTVREMDMVDIDCTSLTGLTGFALPYMERGSRIINTASLASFLPLGNFAVYGACKAFVLSLTVALAAELKDKGIKVTALCPGPVSTEFADVASKGARKEVRHGVSPEKTVEHAIRCSRKGKLYSMWTFKWKFKAAASRFVGRYFGARMTYLFCKRPSN